MLLSADSIASDRRHGATELASRAAALLMDAAAGGDWRNLADELQKAQPAMAGVLRVALEVGRARSADEAAEVARRWQRRLAESARAVARHASALVRGRVLTHSYSSLVFGAIVEAQRSGSAFQVVTTESQPGGEGRRLAADLASRGVDVRVIADTAAGAALQETSVVLIGADSVSPLGVLNKTGSSLIAAAARLRRRPVYALFGEEKIWPEALPAGDLFDRTPLDWFAGFVTDQGIRPSLAGAPLWPVEARPAQRLLD